ncbi:hypothetical protein TRICI_003113 [Trichomonascus ciferrii]|uniref:Mis6-domain-containing protein n=1 Tax=Trichomonascus ciferrii TaxID=44093 RepID=A0A642V4T4_9ASCO|nr:hypothetical protein TRICI_003113 [Trichomonascus ciferrii]
MVTIEGCIERLCKGGEEGLEKQELDDLLFDLNERVPVYGLNKGQLDQLLGLVTRPSKVPAAVCGRIIRDLLLPNEPIGDDSVIRVVSCLGQDNRIPMQSKSKLLRWLVVVFDFLEDPKVVAKLYGVLFGNLKYESSRMWTCHLLFLSTTPTLVRPWRVAYLKELYEKNRESQHLLALLRLYKDYAPELVPESLPPVRGTTFRHPDTGKMKLISRLQNKREEEVSSSSYYKMSSLAKRQKIAIPQIQTRALLRIGPPSFGIEDVQNLQDFAENIHMLRLPLQMGSALGGNEMLAKLLRYYPSTEGWERVDTFLRHALQDTKSKSSLNSLLDGVAWLGHQTGTIPQSAKDFVIKEMNNWDTLADSTLYILSTITPPPVDKLKSLLEKDPIRVINSLLSNATPEVASLLDSYAVKHLQDVKVQDAILRYHEISKTEMLPSLALKLLQSTLPMTISRTCGLAASSNSPEVVERVRKVIESLPSSGWFYSANVDTIKEAQRGRFSINRQAQHEDNEPVTPESLKRVKNAGGVDLSFDLYRQKLINHLQDEGYLGLQQAAKSLGMV